MVILKKIYSKPLGLFKEVEFKKGLNFVLGIPKKEKGVDKISLNSIGKSTLITLIDFCLLSSFNKAHGLYSAKSFLDKYKIVLELEIKGKLVKIERGTDLPDKISIFESSGESFESIEIEVARKILFEMFFANSNYKGIQENTWLRSIIPIFLRDEHEGYTNPIQYLKQVNEMTSNIYHLMLLDIDNTLSISNKKILEEIKKKKEDINGIEKILIEEYKDIGAINSKLDKLEKEIEVLNSIMETIDLEETYKSQEEEADKLTEKIKSIILKNGILKNQLGNYKKSHELKIDIDTNKIKKIYGELNEELGIKLSKTLNEAIDYKHKLLNSRKNFIQKKMIEIEKKIELNNSVKEKLKQEQKRIISFLEEKKVFSDVKKSFKILNEKEKEYGTLKGKISLLETLKQALLRLDVNYSELLEQINNFIVKQQNEIGEIRRIYTEIYEKLYPKEGEGFFDIIFSKGKDSKISIRASSKDARGFGKNRGCILVYDLTILFNILLKDLPFPRFWIHDGVFYGVYKNQLMDTLKLIKEKFEENENFQYIVTLNLDEQGRVKSDIKKMGINIDKCMVASYSNLSNEKIFGRDF